MSDLVEFVGEFYQGTPVRNLGRITVISGSRPPIVQADVASIELKIFDLTPGSAPTTNLYTGAAPVVASTVFNTLQTGSEWPDDIGYCFDHTVAATALASKGEHVYKFEYVFTMTVAAEGPLVNVWIWKCRRRRGA